MFVCERPTHHGGDISKTRQKASDALVRKSRIYMTRHRAQAITIPKKEEKRDTGIA